VARCPPGIICYASRTDAAARRGPRSRTASRIELEVPGRRLTKAEGRMNDSCGRPPAATYESLLGTT